MKSLLSSFLFLLFYSCTDSSNTAPAASENDVDAARNFIRAALDGHYDDARSLVVPDSVNHAWIDLFKRNYQSHMSMADKAGYRGATINIYNVQSLNDSTTVIRFSNSYKKKADSLKVVRQKNNWLVDLAYTFPSQPTDSMP